MVITVRIQGLPPLADSIHIRNFFSGLKIPYGGVSITGGIHGEAFVTFETYPDVCTALSRSGRLIMDSYIYVSCDSIAELQKAYKAQQKLMDPDSKPDSKEPEPESKEPDSKQPEAEPSLKKCSYLRITMVPVIATVAEVKLFFSHLSVKNVIFLTKIKKQKEILSGHAIVKFCKFNEAHKALCINLMKRKKTAMKTNPSRFFVKSMKLSNQNEWIQYGGEIDPDEISDESDPTSLFCNQSSETLHDDFHSLYVREYYARLMNVSLSVEREHIRGFLYDLVDDSQITFVYDKNGSRTRECFVMFITENDYTRVLGLDKAILKGRLVRVLPVSKAHMVEIIESKRKEISEDPASEEESQSEVKCLYLRNFASNVRKGDILDFLTGFSLDENDIHLLYNESGYGLGEAVVKFSTEEEARIAEQLNHKAFKGTQILLSCIAENKLKVFGIDQF